MNRRARKDVSALLVSDLEVELQDDNIMQFYVYLDGPAETPYAGGRFKLHATLPENYPFKSPSVGFCTKILHPNVDWRSGSICLDVLNSRWTPVSDLLSVFTQFLPQLLRYPNPSDPLNGEAAQMLLSQPAAYADRVASIVHEFASPGAGGAAAAQRNAADTTPGGGSQAQAQSQAGDNPAPTHDADGTSHAAYTAGSMSEPAFDFDGVDVGTMDGASCVSDMSDFAAGEL